MNRLGDTSAFVIPAGQLLHTYIHTYPLRSSGLFRPMYRSMCWHVQLHAHASPVPYSCKETSHSASDSLIDVLTCLD